MSLRSERTSQPGWLVQACRRCVFDACRAIIVRSTNLRRWVHSTDCESHTTVEASSKISFRGDVTGHSSRRYTRVPFPASIPDGRRILKRLSLCNILALVKEPRSYPQPCTTCGFPSRPRAPWARFLRCKHSRNLLSLLSCD